MENKVAHTKPRSTIPTSAKDKSKANMRDGDSTNLSLSEVSYNKF